MIIIGVHIQLMVVILHNRWLLEVTTVLAGSKDLLLTCKAFIRIVVAMITIVAKEVMYLIIRFLPQCLLPFLGMFLVIPLPLLWVDLHPR
jgi:hypothetical protein